MSLRRPATAAGPRKHTMPPPVSTSFRRPKSALAKSSASSVDDPTAQEDAPSSTSPSRQRFKKPTSAHDGESHIQVVIRCRRRSDREVQDGSPVIITTSGTRGEDVTVETASPSSTLGVVMLPPTRTYPFDRVFGPEADQAMVYNDVVAPVLEQVLAGYNCTLFAYGQTGTGKTHTMQGDLIPSSLGIPSAGAGMIPRALFKLFQHLESHASDFSVKISFVELYNEELRDLLAAEMTTPIGNTQPMGMGNAQQPQAQGTTSLKIFDDSSKRGVFIQGLEETAVKDAADAIALLTKGSQRRQIAATKFNDHSSRSHSVFSITVHLKESSALGDDLLKVGKLNLVDLAGSENIGRSGAENKRAKEAGMINQSLLTLGRVINALVEKSSHVPYRESKLTRLLQDSLGGRTKTCIIATISPARCNLEETLSTLEYALRAKSIRNKPEVNQRLTKNALIKEYVAEIERLKADLLAAREMNGIYFSQDSWDQMTSENEARQAQHDEAKRHAAIVESQLNVVREEFEQCMGLLLKREGELTAAQETLRSTTEQLQAKEGEIEEIKDELAEEVILREAHAKTEASLNSIANELRNTLEQSVEDVHGLFDKLSRKSAVARLNAQAVSKHGKSLGADAASLSIHLQEFVHMHNQLNTKLRDSAQQFQATGSEMLTAQSNVIDGQLQRLADYLKVMRFGEAASEDAIDGIVAAVNEAGEAMKDNFKEWSINLTSSCESLRHEFQATWLRNASAVEKAFKVMAAMLDTVVREAGEYVTQEQDAAVDLSALVRNNANTEIDRLRQQNALLAQLLHVEKVKSDRACDKLIQRISGLLGEYTEARDQSLREAVSDVRQNASAGETAIAQFLDAHTGQLEFGVKRRRDWDASLEKRGADGKEAREIGIKALKGFNDGFSDGLETVQTKVTSSVTLQMMEMDRQTANMTGICSPAFDKLGRVKRARIDATESMGSEAQDGYLSLQHGVSAFSDNMNQSMSMMMSEACSLDTSTQTYCNTTTAQLSNLQSTTRALLEKGVKEDTPTGGTPRKRHWEYPCQWPLTRPRDEVIGQWRDTRSNGITSPGAVTVSSLQVKTEDVEPTTIESHDSHSNITMHMDPKVENEETVLPFTLPPEATPGLRSTHHYVAHVHRSTGANGFGKITPKIPEFGLPNALKERSTNLLPLGSRRPR